MASSKSINPTPTPSAYIITKRFKISGTIINLSGGHFMHFPSENPFISLRGKELEK